MYPADYRHEIQEHCPLCGRQPKEVREDFGRAIWLVDCEVCGQYRTNEDVLLMFQSGEFPSDIKRPLSAVVRRRWEYTGHPELLTSTNCNELASSAPDRNDVSSKVRYLLGYIAHKSQFPAERVILKGPTDYPVCFSSGVDEFGYYAQYIKEAGFVDGQRSEGPPATRIGEYQYWLTPKGWAEVERIPTLDSPFAFVAMSFTKEGSYGALLTQAFEEAIKLAIEDDAGYQEAVRIDRKDFLGDIVFEIIARIKECRFIVADVTEHRNNVYFEAGYAMGMGLPVIWTCHKDHIDDARLDTRNLNHIVWDNPGELRKSLANRILATIGRGPKKKL